MMQQWRRFCGQWHFYLSYLTIFNSRAQRKSVTWVFSAGLWLYASLQHASYNLWTIEQTKFLDTPLAAASDHVTRCNVVTGRAEWEVSPCCWGAAAGGWETICNQLSAAALCPGSSAAPPPPELIIQIHFQPDMEAMSGSLSLCLLQLFYVAPITNHTQCRQLIVTCGQEFVDKFEQMFCWKMSKHCQLSNIACMSVSNTNHLHLDSAQLGSSSQVTTRALQLGWTPG